jgi:hypothetical protein
MLTEEQAKEALKQFQIPQWEERRIKELAGLGARYAGIGEGPARSHHVGSAQTRQIRPPTMDALRSNERIAIFERAVPRSRLIARRRCGPREWPSRTR